MGKKSLVFKVKPKEKAKIANIRNERGLSVEIFIDIIRILRGCYANLLSIVDGMDKFVQEHSLQKTESKRNREPIFQ